MAKADEGKVRHIRQVHPGNYKKQLGDECIEELNEFSRETCAPFGYQFESRRSP